MRIVEIVGYTFLTSRLNFASLERDERETYKYKWDREKLFIMKIALDFLSQTLNSAFLGFHKQNTSSIRLCLLIKHENKKQKYFEIHK